MLTIGIATARLHFGSKRASATAQHSSYLLSGQYSPASRLRFFDKQGQPVLALQCAALGVANQLDLARWCVATWQAYEVPTCCCLPGAQTLLHLAQPAIIDRLVRWRIISMQQQAWLLQQQPYQLCVGP